MFDIFTALMINRLKSQEQDDMRPADLIPGFAPTREETPQGDGTWKISVTPPEASGLPQVASEIILTADQYAGYQRWKNGELIQNALPDLTPAEREIILSGIGAKAWDAMFDEECAPW